jgi:hypothetical protein
MSNPLEYVITGALMQCSQGTVPMPFKTLPRTSKIAGLLAGNALDKQPLVNIPSFVICQKQTQMAGGTPVPCVPAPLLWQDTYPAKVGGADTLLFRSCINCPLGQGKIEFMTSGQLPTPPGMSQQIKEAKEDANETLKQAELEKNSVGEAGFLEGMIPIWGSGRDLIHAVQTGDKVGMALNAAFLVWDVASVAAGILSFGTATAAMMGAKAGVRAALKASGKVALGLAKKKMAATAAKALALKNGLKALKPFGKKVAQECVTACFPAGTLVAVADDYCAIEDLRVGDLVWAWEPDGGNLALKPIVSVSQRTTHALVALHVANEIIQATPEHPFLLTTNEWKQAGQLLVGDELLRSDGVGVPVREAIHDTEHTTLVYNLEVADWHTYLVGQWMLVVHNGPCEDALKWTIGTYEDLTKAAAGLPLDAHHLLQAEKMSALLKKLGLTFDHAKGISILVPEVGHRFKDPLKKGYKCISRWNGKKLDKYIKEAEDAGKSLKQISRDLLAKDIKEMRRVYGNDVPNSALKQLVEMHKKDFPQLFLK